MLEYKEKVDALNFLRNRLPEKRIYEVQAIALLKDQESLPILERMLKKEKDLEWQVIISRALNEIGGGQAYADILLKYYLNNQANCIRFYSNYLNDLKNMSLKNHLIKQLKESSGNNQHGILRILNWVETGTHFDEDDFLPKSLRDFGG